MRKDSMDSESQGFVSLRPHDEYYLSGGDLFFLVGRYHFRVHRYFFERESSYFQRVLLAPAAPGGQRSGISETSSIVLSDVGPEEFARFLWVFYNPTYSLYDTTVEEWTSILDLAYRWSFPEVKALVVRELEKKLEIDHVDRIYIYHKYEIDRNLLIRSYTALCERPDPLTLEEGLKLGMETTLNVARAREYARVAPTAGGLRSPVPASVDPIEMRAMVLDLFSITDEPAGSDTATVNGDAENKNTSGTTFSTEATPADKGAGAAGTETSLPPLFDIFGKPDTDKNTTVDDSLKTPDPESKPETPATEKFPDSRVSSPIPTGRNKKKNKTF